MKEFDLIVTPLGSIRFFPENEAVEILQNVATIINTQKYSVPLDREFGLEVSMLDAPMQKSKSALKAEIIQAVRKYEPRAKITQIKFDENLDGKLITRLKVAINEE